MAKELIELYVGDNIKIGQREFTIKEHDYIMDNKSNHLCFCAGGRRTLYYTKNGRFNNSHSYIQIPLKLSKKLNLKVLRKIEFSPEESKTQDGLIYYKFNNK